MSATQDDFDRFHNNLRIMASIDRHELIDAGLTLSDKGWERFSENPWLWLIKSGDAAGGAVWSIIQARQPRKTREKETV